MRRSVVATRRPTGSSCECGLKLTNTPRTVKDSPDRVNRVHGLPEKLTRPMMSGMIGMAPVGARMSPSNRGHSCAAIYDARTDTRVTEARRTEFETVG